MGLARSIRAKPVYSRIKICSRGSSAVRPGAKRDNPFIAHAGSSVAACTVRQATACRKGA